MLAASGGANAQSASPEKPEASAKAAKKRTKAAVVSPIVAPGPYGMVTKGPQLPVTPAWTGLYAGVSFGPGLFRANTSTVFHSVNNQIIT